MSNVQLSDVYDKQSLMFGTEADVLWYRPSSLKELFSLKERYQHARLVSGATTIGSLPFWRLHLIGYCIGLSAQRTSGLGLGLRVR